MIRELLYTVRYWEIEIRNKTYLVVVPPKYLVGHFIVAILYLLLILDFSGSFFMTKFLIEYKEYGLYYGAVFSFLPAALVMAAVVVKDRNMITKFRLKNMPLMRDEYIKEGETEKAESLLREIQKMKALKKVDDRKEYILTVCSAFIGIIVTVGMVCMALVDFSGKEGLAVGFGELCGAMIVIWVFMILHKIMRIISFCMGISKSAKDGYFD